MKVHAEITDTIYGEANYSYVKRYTLNLPDMSTTDYIVRNVKREIEWNGKRCRREDFGDMVKLTPHGENRVCFITFGS